MNLSNADLLSIETPGVADRFGDEGDGVTTSMSVRCTLIDDSTAQRLIMYAKVQDATAVLYVLFSALPPGQVPVVGSNLSLQLDGHASPTTYEVVDRKEAVKEGGLSHHQCFVKVMR